MGCKYSCPLQLSFVSDNMYTCLVQPFPISPRLPPAAIAHLLRVTDAKRLLLSKATLPGVEQQLMAELQSLAPGFDLVIDSMPSVSDLYPDLGKRVGFDGPLDEFAPVSQLLSNTAIIIHSSGTTGLPKPIRQSYSFTIHFACSGTSKASWVVRRVV